MVRNACNIKSNTVQQHMKIIQEIEHLQAYSISQEICTWFCFAVLCCGYTLTDFPISIRLTSLALWQSNDCPSASKAILMNMDKYFMWIHYERLHNHNKAKHNKTVCIFLGIYCMIVMCPEQGLCSKTCPVGLLICSIFCGENARARRECGFSSKKSNELTD